MKHIFFLLIAAAAFVGCKDDNKGQLDPNAMVSLRPEATKADPAPGHLSALQIVKECAGVWFYSPTWNLFTSRGFADKQRDTVDLRLMMWGTDVIDMYGKLDPVFIDGVDVVFSRVDRAANVIRDTIAYIPNRTLRAAAAQIREAYAAEDYARCYKIFDEAYRFIPITGAQWRELKARGEN